MSRKKLDRENRIEKIFNYILYGRLAFAWIRRLWLVVFFVGSLSNYVDACRVFTPLSLSRTFFLLGSPLFGVKGFCILCVSYLEASSRMPDPTLFFVLQYFLSLVQFAVHLTRHLVGAYGDSVILHHISLSLSSLSCCVCIAFYIIVSTPLLFSLLCVCVCVCHVASHPSHPSGGRRKEYKKGGRRELLLVDRFLSTGCF